MTAALDDPLTSSSWMHYALRRVREIVDKPREHMTDAELAIYKLVAGALDGGQPIVSRLGPVRTGVCRVCGAEWPLDAPAAHEACCPVRSAGAA